MRLMDLEGRPTGGGSSTKGLRVVAVNDGLPVFDSRDALPDSITLTVQTDTSIHAPVTVRLRGQETQAGIAVVIGTRGDTAISPGVVERVTFQLTSAQKDLIENVAQGRNGTADISIYGASASGGSATRQATFAVYIKNSLASMIGPTNRNEILVNGLPNLIPNIIQTVLANMTKRHNAINLLGGVGNPSVTIDTTSRVVTIPEILFSEYLKAEWLYLYIANAKTTVAATDLSAAGSEHFRIPLDAMNRATGDLPMVRQHFQRGGNLNTNYIDFAVSGNRRQLSIRETGIGGIGTDVLWAVAYVPTYRFSPPSGSTVISYVTTTFTSSQGLSFVDSTSIAVSYTH